MLIDRLTTMGIAGYGQQKGSVLTFASHVQCHCTSYVARFSIFSFLGSADAACNCALAVMCFHQVLHGYKLLAVTLTQKGSWAEELKALLHRLHTPIMH